MIVVQCTKHRINNNQTTTPMDCTEYNFYDLLETFSGVHKECIMYNSIIKPWWFVLLYSLYSYATLGSGD